MNGISALVRVLRELAPSLCSLPRERLAFCSLGASSYQAPTRHPHLGLIASSTVRNQFLLFINRSSYGNLL